MRHEPEVMGIEKRILAEESMSTKSMAKNIHIVPCLLEYILEEFYIYIMKIILERYLQMKNIIIMFLEDCL